MNTTLTTKDTVFAKITELVCANTGVDAEKITLESNFHDLGLDSLDALAMISDLEQEYGVKVPNQEILRIKTVGQAVESLSNRIK
jgi:acyl carrier protein